jgi:hypothetical protein
MLLKKRSKLMIYAQVEAQEQEALHAVVKATKDAK